ncbi:cytochrome P450 Tp4149-like [Bidens hawaiensis]|uniref:cytochrome P450 Tp4149-like n=1 Tax=Bidens hawaiensis TaxID=980011 RepID=UPI004049C6EA
METIPSFQTILFTLFSSLIFIIYIRNKWISYYSNKNINLPPSPNRLPIIGHLHKLGSNPHRSLEALSRQHGPVMLLHLGSIPTLVASSSEAAEQIMKTHDISFASRPYSAILDILLYGFKDLAFAPNGEYWRQLRSIVASQLLSSAQVKSFKNVRQEEIGLMIGMFEKSCGSVVDVTPLFDSLAENIVCRVSIGRTCDGLVLTKILRKYLTMFTRLSVGSYIPWLSWVDRVSGLMGQAEEVTKKLDEFLEDVIKEHVNKKSTGDSDGNDEAKDFIDILLNVQKDKTTGFSFGTNTIKALITDIFGGGIDNTSTNLEWMLSELIRNPRVMKKLQKEITEVAQGRSIITEEDLDKMQYLKAVIKESMRLHPPLPLLLPRIATQDVKIMGYDVPSGTQVLVNAWKIGRDSRLWEEPKEFKPERFLTNSINYKGHHFEWIPFGAGRRSCPGVLFSVAIFELAIANIVYKFDMALPNGVNHEDLDMSEKFGITVHRKFPLLVTATPRF